MNRNPFVLLAFSIVFAIVTAPATAQVCINDTCMIDRGLTGEIDLGPLPLGISVLDYDLDGYPDLVIGDRTGFGWHLFHNVPDPARPGNRTFADETTESGLNDADALNGLSFATAVADYDNDGDPDLYTSCRAAGNAEFGCLYRNDGDGKFTNVSVSAGIRLSPVGVISASWNDYELDGDVDLFVAATDTTNQQIRLFENQGDGTFTNASQRLPNIGSLGAMYGHIWADYDDDGFDDLVLPGTFSPRVYRNVADPISGRRLEDVTPAVGFTSLGPAPMGIAAGDYDNDGDFDFSITDAVTGTYYEDVGNQLVRVFPFTTMFGWGTTWLDVDNDGDLDNYQAGSSGQYNFDALVRNDGNGQFTSIKPALNGPFAASQESVQLDFNNDGRRDIITLNPGSPEFSVSVYENISTTGNNWVQIRLLGDGATVNRDAIGAQVRLTAGGVTQIRAVHSGSSTASTEDLRLHFGLGDANQIDSIEVRWPRSGNLENRTSVLVGPFAANQIITLTAQDGTCTTPFGDVFPSVEPIGDCVVSLDDILCVIRAFGNPAMCPTADILPCGGDGIVNLDDLLGVLSAFAGNDLCP